MAGVWATKPFRWTKTESVEGEGLSVAIPRLTYFIATSLAEASQVQCIQLATGEGGGVLSTNLAEVV